MVDPRFFPDVGVDWATAMMGDDDFMPCVAISLIGVSGDAISTTTLLCRPCFFFVQWDASDKADSKQILHESVTFWKLFLTENYIRHNYRRIPFHGCILGLDILCIFQKEDSCYPAASLQNELLVWPTRWSSTLNIFSFNSKLSRTTGSLLNRSSSVKYLTAGHQISSNCPCFTSHSVRSSCFSLPSS